MAAYLDACFEETYTYASNFLRRRLARTSGVGDQILGKILKKVS